MFTERILERFNLDHSLNWLPFMFALILILFEKDSAARFVVFLTIYIIFIIYLIARKNDTTLHRSKDRAKIRGIIRTCVIFAIPIAVSWNNLFYFLFGVITITLALYTLFEIIGDITESVLHNTLKIPLMLASFLRFCVWIIGLMVYIILFFSFIIRFIHLYPNHQISLMILKSQSNVVMIIGVTIFSLLNALFILDFLIKLVFIDLKPINITQLSRLELQQLFIRVIIVILFSDLAYSLLYLTFSGVRVQEVSSFLDYLYLWRDYLRAFFYAFCLHFAISLPTTSFFVEIDKIVKSSSAMQIIQFFHFCLNKVVDITILAYMAGIILTALGIKKESSKE